jgi:hypothetical protein
VFVDGPLAIAVIRFVGADTACRRNLGQEHSTAIRGVSLGTKDW